MSIMQNYVHKYVRAWAAEEPSMITFFFSFINEGISYQVL